MSRTHLSKNFKLVLWSLTLLLGAACAQAQRSSGDPIRGNTDTRVRLDQKLDAQIPLDLQFTDENGKSVRLAQYFGKKPVVLALIFYRCTGSCTEILNGLTKTFKKGEFVPGNGFETVIVSIAPKETPQDAMQRKQECLQKLEKPQAAAGWHFLTGEKSSIDRLAESIGYHYVYDEERETFNHPAGILVLTPTGKTSQYFYGFNYQPKDLRASLETAKVNKIGSMVEPIFFGCMVFDPLTGKYTLDVIRSLQVFGTATLLIVVFSVVYMSFRYRRTALGRPGVKDDPGMWTAS
jgi:protein SCO1/2